MGRLDNIIARNRRPARMQERVIVSMVLGAIILLVIGLAVFTDLGLPPEARDAPARRAEPAAEPRGSAAPDRGQRVDGILLRKQPVKPATAAPAP